MLQPLGQRVPDRRTRLHRPGADRVGRLRLLGGRLPRRRRRAAQGARSSGCWPVGAVGMWRLTKPIGLTPGRGVVATVAYVAVPVPANAMAEGRWGGLVAYALFPWVVAQLAAASGLAPFGDVGGSAGPGVRPRPLVHRVIAVGVITALAATVQPAIMVVVAGCAVALVLGGLLAGQVAGSVRVLRRRNRRRGRRRRAAAPVEPRRSPSGWDAVVGASSSGGYTLDLTDLLRFAHGPVRCRRPELGCSWSPRRCRCSSGAGGDWDGPSAGGSLAAAGFGVAWAGGQGWLPGDLPAPDVLLAPAAVGLALAAGLGMAAFEVDLPDYHFGWRQIVSLLAGAAFVGGGPAGARAAPCRAGGTFPGATTTGRSRSSTPSPPTPRPSGSSGSATPAPSRSPVGASTPPRSTISAPTARWPSPRVGRGDADDRRGVGGRSRGAASDTGSALQVAAAGGTTRLGALLAPMAVRYVVVPAGTRPRPLRPRHAPTCPATCSPCSTASSTSIRSP